MNRIYPAPADRLLKGLPRIFQPLLVIPVGKSVGFTIPEQVGDEVGDKLHPGF
ncbi:MAG: hypothetical protein RMX89_22850 [Nostoc sp. DedSLP04]|nr:hypothetical protein [Nostoc sp. DedSLP04]MDZ8033895.1 hypothetical protein [Nostoc sp. DedSLP04]